MRRRLAKARDSRVDVIRQESRNRPQDPYAIMARGAPCERLAKARALHNWSGSWGAYGGWGGPGDALGDEVGYRIGVVREDADGVAEEAAFVGVQGGFEAVAATAFVFL